jgi:hypothetical protein
MEHWHPDVLVYGLHELVGNALVMPGETARVANLRGEPLAPAEGEEG